jgi:protein-S-isoprenylcysteine O-methyltransferase Ste14
MAAGDTDNPGVIALPPHIYLAAILLGAVLHWIVPFPIQVPALARWVAGLVIAACIGFATWARITFTRAGTNVNPRQPSLLLVESGPFRVTRNPMYVAMAVALFALAFATRVAWYLVLVPPVLALMHWGVVLREERYLSHKFGAPYDEYRQRVRRYL